MFIARRAWVAKGGTRETGTESETACRHAQAHTEVPITMQTKTAAATPHRNAAASFAFTPPPANQKPQACREGEKADKVVPMTWLPTSELRGCLQRMLPHFFFIIDPVQPPRLGSVWHSQGLVTFSSFAKKISLGDVCVEIHGIYLQIHVKVREYLFFP